MSKFNCFTRRAVLGTLAIVTFAGCTSEHVNASSSTPDGKPSESRFVCATVAMADKRPATVDMTEADMALEIPGALELQGSMSGGVVVLDFNRPEYGKLECRYEQESDGVLSLRGCDEDAGRGALVEADRMTVRFVSSATVKPSTTVTACANKSQIPRRASPPDTLPGFTRLPNGEVLPPTEEGIAIESEPVEFSMTGEMEQEYRVTAERDAAVMKLLGQRFAFSYSDTVDPPKGQEPDSIHVKLWFFSHTHSTSVWVRMKNGAVEESGEVAELFLPEGADEVLAAVELARKHPALAGRVNDLEGGGMAALLPADSPWRSLRVIDVRFFDASRVSHYVAMVDLTNERVLEAGPAN